MCNALGIGSVWLGTWPQMERVAAQAELFEYRNISSPLHYCPGYPDETVKERKDAVMNMVISPYPLQHLFDLLQFFSTPFFQGISKNCTDDHDDDAKSDDDGSECTGNTPGCNIEF